MGTTESPRLELLRSAPLDAWIAVSRDESRVLATGKTFVEADTAAQKTGEEGYFLIKTPDAWIPRTLCQP
jgi:hypothetical protein